MSTLLRELRNKAIGLFLGLGIPALRSFLGLRVFSIINPGWLLIAFVVIVAVWGWLASRGDSESKWRADDTAINLLFLAWGFFATFFAAF